MGIVWTSVDQVKRDYMQQSYNLYPMAGPAIYLMRDELSKVDNRWDALNIYNRYKPQIDLSIDEMRQYSGESAELTSAMLWMNKILARLYIDYAFSTRTDVEKGYKALIQFDQEKWFTINKQYTLVYYADFLAEINDIDGAQKVIQILLEDGLDRSLIESLPKTKDLTALRSMSPITDKSIQNFIDFLWPIIK